MLVFPSLDCFAGDTEGSQGRRYVGVDACLHEDSANFVLGNTIGKRAIDVHAEFVMLTHSSQHADVQQATGFERQRVITPDRTSAVLGDKSLHWLVESRLVS